MAKPIAALYKKPIKAGKVPERFLVQTEELYTAALRLRSMSLHSNEFELTLTKFELAYADLGMAEGAKDSTLLLLQILADVLRDMKWLGDTAFKIHEDARERLYRGGFQQGK